MTTEFFNFDYVKKYSTHDRLMAALKKYADLDLRDALPIIIPYGKNAGRHTAITGNFVF